MEVLAGAALFLGLLIVLLWWAARSAITLFVLEVNNGKIAVTKGRPAPSVIEDLRAIVKKPKVKRATLRIVRHQDRARVEHKGELSHEQLQRIRNVVGNTPLPRLTAPSA